MKKLAAHPNVGSRYKLVLVWVWRKAALVGWLLALLAFSGAAAATEYFESSPQPPDTSSPRARLHSFLDNFREADYVLMPAYAAYLTEPNLFPSASTREAEARSLSYPRIVVDP